MLAFRRNALKIPMNNKHTLSCSLTRTPSRMAKETETKTAHTTRNYGDEENHESPYFSLRWYGGGLFAERQVNLYEFFHCSPLKLPWRRLIRFNSVWLAQFRHTHHQNPKKRNAKHKVSLLTAIIIHAGFFRLSRKTFAPSPNLNV